MAYNIAKAHDDVIEKIKLTSKVTKVVSDNASSVVNHFKFSYHSLFCINMIMKLMAIGVAAPGFNSLISAPSVPSLISTEPIELLCRISNISSTDPFCFVKQKTGSG